jgi:hypothetical protein
MIIVNRQQFDALVSDSKLAYLLTRFIEHPCSSDSHPTYEYRELREYLTLNKLATNVTAWPRPNETDPAKGNP